MVYCDFFSHFTAIRRRVFFKFPFFHIHSDRYRQHSNNHKTSTRQYFVSTITFQVLRPSVRPSVRVPVNSAMLTNRRWSKCKLWSSSEIKSVFAEILHTSSYATEEGTVLQISSGVGTGGFRRFNEPGPPSSWGPRVVGPQKNFRQDS